MSDVIRPAVVLGMGCARGALPQDAITLAKHVLSEAGVAGDTLSAVASIDIKADEPALVAIAAHFGVPLLLFSAAVLERETPRLRNPSEKVFALTGCHGVAEAAALAAVGNGGKLMVGKTVGKRVTAAVASVTAIDEPGGMD